MTENVLDKLAKELGTYPIELSFFDDQNNPVTPDTMTWTLTDLDGNVVNSRLNIPIGTLSTVVTVILSGDDLQIIDGDEYEDRVLTAIGTYTSSLGGPLPLTDQVRFTIENLYGTT